MFPDDRPPLVLEVSDGTLKEYTKRHDVVGRDHGPILVLLAGRQHGQRAVVLADDRERGQQQAPALRHPGELETRFLGHLPFQLTAAQQRVIAEIRSDLARSHPMQRLLQGDVGSGKTVVADLAAVMVNHSGAQAAIMALFIRLDLLTGELLLKYNISCSMETK